MGDWLCSCADCNTTENLQKVLGDFNVSDFWICDDCNEARYESFISDYY